MGGDKNPLKEVPNAETKPDEQQPVAGPGVGSLLRGSRQEANVFAPAKTDVKEAEAVPSPTPKPLIPSWYFFAADLLLIAFTLLFVYKSPGPLDAKSTIFCIIAIMLAGVFGALGVIVGRKR
jgi:hypothetical protein